MQPTFVELLPWTAFSREFKPYGWTEGLFSPAIDASDFSPAAQQNEIDGW
jgi:hypothetical protein